ITIHRLRSCTSFIPRPIFFRGLKCCLPLEKEFIDKKNIGLQNFTLGCKYHFRVSKCIGISFQSENVGYYSLEWCYLESPWEYQEEMHFLLEKDNPFRKTNIKEINCYHFNE
ncbi:hypothetical protein K8I31_22105, partial [bacterium]|nr:hypothetical protein [bacterium]